MRLGKEKIQQLAKVCMFELEEDAIEKIDLEFEQLMENMKALEAIDTTNIEPMIYCVDQVFHYMREDDVIENVSLQEVLSNVPNKIDNFVSVAKVVKDEQE